MQASALECGDSSPLSFAHQLNNPSDPPPDALECGDSSPRSLERQVTDLPEPPALDTWELDEQLRHVARLLGLKATDGAAPARVRLDPAQPAASGWHRTGPRRAAKLNRPRAHRRLRLDEILSSVTTWLGVAALTCGASLLGWAEFSSRVELQTIGLLIAIGGTLVLALGMTLRLSQPESRSASPSAQRRIDPNSSNTRHGPHSRRPTGQHAERAA
jgi:hypothetical protein